VNFK
jgi:hypothetical protein